MDPRYMDPLGGPGPSKSGPDPCTPFYGPGPWTPDLTSAKIVVIKDYECLLQ